MNHTTARGSYISHVLPNLCVIVSSWTSSRCGVRIQRRATVLIHNVCFVDRSNRLAHKIFKVLVGDILWQSGDENARAYLRLNLAEQLGFNLSNADGRSRIIGTVALPRRSVRHNFNSDRVLELTLMLGVQLGAGRPAVPLFPNR